MKFSTTIYLFLVFIILYVNAFYEPIKIEQRENLISIAKESAKKNKMESIEDLKLFRNVIAALSNLKGTFARTCDIFDKYQLSNQTQNLPFEGYLISDILRYSSQCNNDKLSQIHKQIYQKYGDNWSKKKIKIKNEKIYFEMIQEYYYLMKIFQNQPPNSIKAQEFVKELGNSFVKYLYPHLTNHLDLKFAEFTRFTKEVGYMIEMVNFFKEIAPDANKGHMEMIIQNGLSRIINKSFVLNKDQRAFATIDQNISDIEFNFIILKGIFSNGIDKIISIYPQECFQFFNWFLSKKKLIINSDSIYYFQILTDLQSYIPTIEVIKSKFPEEISFKTVDYLRNDFSIDNITASISKLESNKSIALSFTKGDNIFTTRNIKIVGPSLYSISLQLTKESISFNSTLIYQISTNVDIQDPKNNKDSVSFSVSINGTDASSKIDHAYIEFRHTKYKGKVYVDSERTIVKDKIIFRRKLINSRHPEGKYDIYVCAYDRMLMKEPTKIKVGTLFNKYGIKNGNDIYTSRKSFSFKGDLDKEQDE